MSNLSPLSALTAILRFSIRLVTLLLSIRFLLKLFGANPAASFAIWIYSYSNHFLKPFFSVFPDLTINHNLVFESTTLLAIVIYGILGELIASIIEAVNRLIHAFIDKKRLTPAEKQYRSERQKAV